jgi:hypothetical protein
VIIGKVEFCRLIADVLFANGNAIAWWLEFFCFGEVIVGACTSLEGTKDESYM